MKPLELETRRALKAVLSTIDSRYVRPGPRILIYHQVGAGLAREMEVTRAAFESQMSHLADHWKVVSLEDALQRPDDDSVVLTFDDGYRDTATTAHPILRDLGLPYTLYLATESIETGRSIGPSVGAEPLSWAQIETMMSDGLVTIGAHTHSHADLRSAERQEVEQEIERSNALITSRLGVEPRHFAYPWGWWSSTAHDLVESHYETAVLGGGAPVTNETDPSMLNRIPIQLSDRVRGFRGKLHHGGRTEERLRRRLKRYSGP